jgi:hypothetical protein
VRRLVAGQPLGTPWGGFSFTELTGGEEMDRNLSEWRLMNVLNECTVIYYKYQNKQKEWNSCHQTFTFFVDLFY